MPARQTRRMKSAAPTGGAKAPCYYGAFLNPSIRTKTLEEEVRKFACKANPADEYPLYNDDLIVFLTQKKVC